MTPDDKLEPLTPREGVKLYKQDRSPELADATLQSHGYRLQRFIEFCEDTGLENLNELTGRDLHRYKIQRQSEVSKVTTKSHLDTLRVFLRFCETIDAVRNGIADSVVSPKLSTGENVCGDILPADRVESILAYLDKYRYATFEHALIRLMWESGMRTGSIRALDVCDPMLRDGYVELRHRPESETPLKNKKSGERSVALSSKLSIILDDYITEQRPAVNDDYERHPLFATTHGRASKNTIRYRIYQISRPCQVGRECPYDREPSTCEAMTRRYSASKCPDSRSPHAVRTGAITHFLSEDVPKTVVSDRMDVSEDVLDEHYDERKEKQKMQQRRDHLPKF